jgi:hypothetical protein
MKRIIYFILFSAIISLSFLKSEVLAESLTVSTTVTISSPATYDNVLVTSGGVLIADAEITVLGDMTIQSGGVVTHSVRLLSGLQLNVTGTLDVQSGGMIDVSWKGLLGAPGGNDRLGESFDPITGAIIKVTPEVTGASYGGLGGPGWYPASIYGSEVNPLQLGSGGGGGAFSSGQPGGNGGGAVFITAETLVINGTIAANGQSGLPTWPGSGGGGSGGTVNIDAGLWIGNGTITANGGNSGNGNGSGGGGGGRISIKYTNKTFTGNVRAIGGVVVGSNSYTSAGGAGTIYIKSAAMTYGDLLIDNEGIVPGCPDVTLLSSLGARTFKTVEVKNQGKLIITSDMSPFTVEDLTVSGIGNVRVTGSVITQDLCNVESGSLLLFENGSSLSTSRLRVNGSNSRFTTNISLSFPNATDLELSGGGIINIQNNTVFSLGQFDPVNIQSGTFNLTEGCLLDIATNNVVIGGGVTLVKDGTFGISDLINSITIQSGGVLTHSVRLLSGLRLNVTGTLDVQSGGLIDASSKGLRGGGDNGSVFGLNGETFDAMGNIVSGATGTYNNGSAGASYGGYGQVCTTGSTNNVYGTVENPQYLGSGGGARNYRGGNGGGRITILATNCTVNGTINASAISDSYWGSGGSGGSVYIDVNSLSGNGSITATGASDNGNAGGGGGRIAVYYNTMTFPNDNISVYGNIGLSTLHGSSGSIYLKDKSQTYGDLIIDNANIVSTVNTPLLTNLTIFTNIFIRNKGRLIVSDNYSFLNTEILLTDGVLISDGTFQLQNSTLTGSGYVLANLINNGHINPGLSAGSISIIGNYTQLPSGTLNIEIGGTTPASGYDQLNISGSATLDGTLNVSLINGFVPAINNQFAIMNYASKSGTFSTINGWDYNSSYLPNNFSLIVGSANINPVIFNSDWNGSTHLMPNQVCPPSALYQNTSPLMPYFDGDSLVINTPAQDKYMYYGQSGSALSIPDTLAVEFQMRFVSGGTNDPTRVPAHAYINLANSTWNILMIGNDEIFLWSASGVKGPSAYVDTDGAFHTYRIEVIGYHNIRVFYDNNLALIGVTIPSVSAIPDIRFGKSAGFCWGVSKWLSFKHNASAVTSTSPVVLSSPVNGATNIPLNTTLNWNAHGCATSYDFQFSYDSLFATTIINDVSITATSRQVTGLSYGTKYNWRVRGKSEGVVGDWSAVWHFTTLAAMPDLQVTQVQVPSTAYSGQSYQVSWVVKNTDLGGTNTPLWHDGVWFSPDSVFNPQLATYLGQFENISYLNPGETYSNSATFILPQGITGDYYVFVVTDKNNTVYEINETNNRRRNTVAMHVLLTPPPDLQIISLITPDHTFSGQPINVSWEVKNLGTGQTVSSSWSDGVYLSQDTILNIPSSTQLGIFPHSGALAPNGSYTKAVSVNIPQAIYGKYYIHVYTDVSNQVYEYVYELNNTRRNDSLTVTLSPPPDLVVTNIVSPPTGSSGQAITISWTVENQGAGQPFESGWNDRVYLTSTPAFDPSFSIVLGDNYRNGTLAAGSSYTVDRTFTIPNGFYGPNYVFIKTDCFNQVFEYTFEDNNMLRSDTTVQIGLSPWPDLQVPFVYAPANAMAGQSVLVTWKVKNEGSATASSSWNDRIYLSTSSTWNPNTIVGTSDATRPVALLPDSSYTRSDNFNLPWNLSGTYYFYVSADIGNMIYEHTDEGNNLDGIATIQIEPIPPAPPSNLVANNLTSSTIAASGQPIEVSWTVSNLGPGTTTASSWTDGVYLSSDTILNTGNDLLLAVFSHYSALNINQQYSRNQSIVLPNDLSGTYYVFLQADKDYQSNDENWANNSIRFTDQITITLTPTPDLQVTTSGSPAQINSGQPITVEWTVQNNGEGTTPTNIWYDGIYLSNDPYPDYWDIKLGTMVHTEVLDPTFSYSNSMQVEIPIYSSGNNFIIVVTDERNEIYERYAENNNYRTVPINIILPPPADLIVTNMIIPDSAAPGQYVSISWTIENIGQYPAVGWIRDAIYFSADMLWDIDDPTLGVISEYINLQPGGKYNALKSFNLEEIYKSDADGNITGVMPGITPGMYHAIVRTNIKRNIRESNYDNNILISADSLKVDIQSLVLGTTENGTLTSGVQMYYKLNVQPNLDLRVTLTGDVANASNEIYIAYDRMPSLSDFDYSGIEPFQPNQEVLVPSTQQGTYYLLIKARSLPSGIPFENFSLYAEALPFSIISISPDAGGAGGRVTCTILGAGFRDSISVYLRNDQDSLIAGRLIKLINSTELKVRWDLENIPFGDYDVVGINLDSSAAILTKGYAVEAARPLIVDRGYIYPNPIRANSIAELTMTFTNTSNVDLPVMEVNILSPSSTEIISVKVSDGYRKISDFFPDSISNSVQDYYDIEATGINVKNSFLLAQDVPPGTMLQCKITYKHFPYAIFTQEVGIYIMDKESYVCEQIDKIDAYRLRILNYTVQVDSMTFFLASDSSAFTQFYLGELLNVGFLQQEDLQMYLVNCTSNMDNSPKWHDTSNISVQNSVVNDLPEPICFPIIGLDCPEFGTAVCAVITGLICGGFSLLGPVGIGISIPCGIGATWFCTKVNQDLNKICPKIVKACDPNDIIGPVGWGDPKWISINDILPYTIYFENDSTQATAPAQMVTIEQQLDSDLNSNSFRLGSFGFGSFIFNVPENVAFHSQRLDVIDSLGVYVDISAGIDITTNKIFWTFKSIDPATGLPPTDPLTGFLPVNDMFNRGQGFVNYTIRPKTTSQTGDVINAMAEIIFDINEPIETPEIFNTIDAGTPLSSVAPLPPTTEVVTFPVIITGEDDGGGSGLSKYQLYYSQNSGPYTLYNEYIPGDTAEFTGVENSTYRFFSIAIDNVGNTEPMKTTAEATTSISLSAASLNLKVLLEGPFQNNKMQVTKGQDNNSFTYPMENAQKDTTLYFTPNGNSPKSQVVDVVTVELRDAPGDVSSATSNTIVTRKFAFVSTNGTLVNSFGDSTITTGIKIYQNLFVVIKHRNHLPIISAFPLQRVGGIFTYDFTTGADKAFGGVLAQKELAVGKWGMISGDGNRSGLIDMSDKTNVWSIDAGKTGHFRSSDYNLNGNVDNVDKNDYWRPNQGQGSQVPQ